MGAYVLDHDALTGAGLAAPDVPDVPARPRPGIFTPSRCDRFPGWSRRKARLGLFAILFALLVSAIVPIRDPDAGPDLTSAELAAQLAHEKATDAAPDAGERDKDLALYETAVKRVAAGENYYDFIVAEQRARNYPVTPGLAVRLPTLAYLSAWLGPIALVALALVLTAGVIAAWWQRFGEDESVGRLRRMATTMVIVGASLNLNRYYFPLHELWSGMLLSLSFGLHRIGRPEEGGRWGGAWLAAAAALAIRELALPYVLLMGATALWYRSWREAAAWAGLVVLFLAGLAWHLGLVEAQVLPGDPHSPSWLALRGLVGWLGNVVGTSNLRLLPPWLGAPAVILMTVGWAGWKTRTGNFGFLLAAGYGLAFMIAGRWNNFYWGAVIAPVVFAGLAFAPRALVGLWQAANRPDEAVPRGLVAAN